MKKTLLAAALTLGFAGVAQAETSVTLYGVIDTGISYHQVKGNDGYGGTTGGEDFKQTKTGMHDGTDFGAMGSRWGLKGVEELGDGLRAVFQLESGFKTTTGNSAQGGRLFGRHATVGLAGDSWGQLDFGRQTNIASKYLLGVADPFGGSWGQANMGATFGAANTARWDNMVMYQTPNFSGFQFGVGYSFNVAGEQQYKFDDEANPNSRGITTGIRYANGPIGVALTYDQVKKVENGTLAAIGFDGGDHTTKSWNLGASYDFEVVKAYAAFGQSRDGLITTQGYGDLGSAATFSVNPATGVVSTTGDVGFSLLNGKGLKVNSYLLGLSAPIGNGKLMASWNMADARSASDNFETALAGEDYELKKQHTYSLGYAYDLSKRTSVYAVGSYAKNVTFRPDAKSQILGVGLTHRF